MKLLHGTFFRQCMIIHIDVVTVQKACAAYLPKANSQRGHAY